MMLRVGTSLTSVVDATTLVVVRCPDADVKIICGGHEMTTEAGAPSATATAAPDGEGTKLGKRYTAGDLDLELLCVKAGDHPVTVNGLALSLKGARPLPASD